jgi:hypothetical protein
MKPRDSLCRLTFRWIKPPALTFDTIKLPLESHHHSLHLPAPNLANCDDSILPPEWYCGIPLNFLVIASSLRPQPLTRASLRVQITVRNSVEYDSRTEDAADIEPQKLLSLPCQFTCPEPNQITILADCRFFADQIPVQKTELYAITFVRPLKISVSYTPPYLFYEIENCLPYPVWETGVALRGVEKRIIAHLLESGESVRGLSEPIVHQSNLVISWNLSFAKDIRSQPPIPPPPAIASADPVQVSFRNVPRFMQTLVPFDVTMVLKNELGRAVTGELTISLDEQSIKIYSNNRICFREIAPGEAVAFPVTFIALLEGDFLFPPCVFRIAEEAAFTVKPTDGIIIVGNRGSTEGGQE